MSALTDIAKSGSEALGGARFTLVNVLPGTLLVGFVVVLYRSHAFDTGRKVSLPDVLPGKDGAAAATVVFVFGMFLVGVLLRPFQVALVQMLEGYANPRPLHYLYALAVERHRRVRHTAVLQQDYLAPEQREPPRTLRAAATDARRDQQRRRLEERVTRTLGRYPDADELLMPTLLGNVLRQGEEAAGRPYGLEAMAVFPRMYPSVSALLRGDMSRQLDLIATTAALCVTFAAATAVSLPLLWRPDLWRLLPLAVLALALLSYRGAVQASADHAELLATAFDLHRFDLHKALHLALPETPQAELKLNRRLTRFLKNRGSLLDSSLGREFFVHPGDPPGG
ncbi:hypothetical protein [Spirillospora sp. CA-294931]|uniref:hypothetical protein n=1 Tax=Spirillospora sp. CA-294931 TaxID=3240042 RepID=UPI003D8D005F